MRSKSTRNHAFVSPVAACQNVIGLPSFARRPLWPGASLLALVGFCNPKVTIEPFTLALVKRTYGRGFTDGVFPEINFGPSNEVISTLASFNPGEVARIT